MFSYGRGKELARLGREDSFRVGETLVVRYSCGDFGVDCDSGVYLALGLVGLG